MTEQANTSPSPLRVAFCITELDPGGAEQALFEIVSRLDREVIEPLVLCLAEPGELVPKFEAAGIPVTCFGARRWRVPLVRRKLTRELKEFRPQVLQTFLFQANIVGRIAAKKAGVPRVFSGIRVADRRSRWRFWWERKTDHLVHRHICVSRDVAAFFHERTGIAKEKITVIPNGVDVARFANASPFDWRQLGLPTDAKVLLCVGRLDHQKGPDVLLDALEEILPDHTDLHAVLVGEGALRAQLETQKSRIAHGDRIHLIGRRDDVPNLMRAATMFVLPSRWEGMPNVVLEALASELPVVATKVEGIDDLLKDDPRSCVVEVGCAESLAAGIRKCLANPTSGDASRREIPDVVDRLRSWDAVAAAYQILYTNDT